MEQGRPSHQRGDRLTDDRLTIRDRADLARVAMLLQSHGYSIRNLDKCVERDSRDIVAIHRILERQQRTIDLMVLVTAFALMLGAVSITVMTLVMA